MSNFQREYILRQQQATPKLHLMFPQNLEKPARDLHNETSTGAFWDDMHQPRSQELNDQSMLINQSISQDFGTAQDFTMQIENQIYKDVNQKINQSLNHDYSLNEDSMIMSGNQNLYGLDRALNFQNPSDLSMLNQSQGEISKQEPEWIPDEQAMSCYKCKSEFNFFFRRHHCLICRKVFCKNCTSQTSLEMDGAIQRLRACKKCIEQHRKFTDTLYKQQSLLHDTISHDQRRAQSESFVGILDPDKATTPMNLKQVDDQLEYQINTYVTPGQRELIETIKPNDKYFSTSSQAFEQAQTSHAKSGNAMARMSVSNKRVVQEFLQQDGIQRSHNQHTNRSSNRVTDIRTNEWLNHKLRGHLDNMIDAIIEQNNIDSLKWRKILANCTKHAVMTIRPSSRMLADSIDFNSFIKIVNVQYHNQEKCQYINGVVFKKDVASRRMRTQIENPRILLIQNSLGYVGEDEGLSDLQAEIDQQKSFVKIIRQKIQILKPDIIFIEKDASRMALEMLMEDNITIVTVTSAKMLKMIARVTQTIVVPNTNLLTKNFVVGYCLNFRVEQIKPLASGKFSQQHQSLSESTNYIILEGCQAKLGCSIVLSGPDPNELKSVRRALKSCLKTARILLLEREFFRFFMPDMDQFRAGAQLSNGRRNSENTQPEMTFLIEETKEQQSRGDSLATNTADFNGVYDDYQSPYLFEKHMQRGKIVFETYSLVQATKDNTNSDENDYNISQKPKLNKAQSNYLDQKNIQTSAEYSDTSEPVSTSNKGDNSKKGVMTEADLRKKLKNMCTRPKRTIINFLSDEKNVNDMSLFTFLQKAANQFNKPCQEEGCGKPQMLHTSYWYHGSGSVQIKAARVLKEQFSNGKDSKILGTPTFIHCFCVQCRRNIVKKERVPNEVLEMSFFKLLEQFFYNHSITVASARDLDAMAGDSACPHSLFRDCELIFRFGQIKITLSYEHLDAYSLDLFHFGLQKGNITEDEIRKRVNLRLTQLKTNFKEAFNFVLAKLETLSAFMEIVNEGFGSVENINQICRKIVEFLNSFRRQTSDFLVFAIKEIFGEDATTEDFFHLEQRGIKEGTHKGKAAEIKTLMQFNRLHKIMSARGCEYLFILRTLCSIVKNDLVALAFPKKNPFAEVDSHLNQVISNAGNQTVQELAKTMTIVGDLDLSLKASISTVQRRESVLDQSNQLNLNAKVLYKEIALVEYQILNSQAISDLVSQNVFIPPGFNQNAIELIKHSNGTGKKKSMDLAAIIASALSSNLYLNGLAHLDYLNLPATMKPFNGKFTSDSASHQDIIAAAAKQYSQDVLQSQVQLSPDVMNGHSPTESVEEALLSNTSSSFKISFSTHQPTANLEVLVDDVKKKQFVHGYEECYEFFSNCERIADLSAIEQPLRQQVFDQIEQLHYSINMSMNGINIGFGRTRTSLSLEKSQKVPRRSLTSSGRESRSQGLNETDKVFTHELAYREIYHMFHEKIDYYVKVYCPTQFEALRKLYCGPYNEFLHSVFTSDLWKDNSGGKSASTFFKSFDNKYVLKAVQQKEINMFNEMSSSYFEYLCRSFAEQIPTAIAKTLGIFRINIKRGNLTEHFFILLMENLLLNVDNDVSIKYDLKGSKRNRYIPHSKPQQVTLDNNFLYDRGSRPIPMQYSMKRLLKIAIANDSLYLTKHSIIDYSMFVIINPVTKTVRVGIIDYIQQYTLEKELESFLKQKISNEDPTIIPPESYKQRFRTAMDKYFIALVPDIDEPIGSLISQKFKAGEIKWATKESANKNSMMAQLKTSLAAKFFDLVNK